MTQDEIIEMVMQIGGCDRPEDDSPALKMFVAFAKLVAEKERKDCSELCMDLHTLTDGAHNFYQFAANQILKMGQA
jgi:hypothetical protein